jgi:acetylornithine deacetylase/succinyl-diaminopimelate desuccinylase-like protein
VATSETVDLLQHLIRNECVNFNTPESGQEHRSVAVLQSFLEGSGMDLQTFEPAPGRASLVGRIAGSDPTAPSLMLMGHLDVVPANADNWQRDPFGGDFVDGWVWGRGAIDMLNLTTSMAVAVKQLCVEGFRPRGDLVYLAVADEEAGGRLGAGWLVENEPDSVQADYVLSEWGGVPIESPTGSKLWITVGQKGGTDVRMTVRGVAGHASMPFGSDNALVKAAKIVQRLAELQLSPEITDTWRLQVEHMDYDAELTAALLDPTRIDDALGQLSPGMAKRAHACTRTTVSPTVMHGGVKSNVIPDSVELSVLIRRLPGYTLEDVMTLLDDALGDLRHHVDISTRMEVAPTQSPLDTPLWNTLQRVSKKLTVDASCIPALTPGGNDLGYFRDKGSVAYGFGLLSNAISLEDFFSMFHGVDERVDVESLRLSTDLWREVARDLLG